MPQKATLIESHFCAPHTKHFLFRVEDCDRFDFQPGQHVALTHQFQGAPVKRYYSIASPPRGDNSLELCLNLIETSSFTRYLFDLQAGERVQMEGPAGRFVLRKQPRDSLFVATGTGIAPIRSMIHHLLASSSRQVWLLFGVRFEKSIIFREEFDRLAADHPNFAFIPTLSRPGEGWHGATGYVQEHLTRILDGRTDIDAYLCGLNSMVTEVGAALESLGVERGSIVYEKYD